MPRCAIGLGGNIGDVAGAFAVALRRLAETHCSLVALSQLYVTRPVGPHAGDLFQNACALIDTILPPHDLLDLLQQIEHDAGRTRTVRWGSRPLDIDLLTYGDQVLHDSRLTIPHPGLVYRRFVLDPLAEIAPDLVLPVLGRTVDELRQRLLHRPLHILLRGATALLQRRIGTQLRDRFSDRLQLDEAPGADSDQTVIDLDPQGKVTQRPAPTTVVVRLDPQLAKADPVAACVAAVTAMLDEPTPVGEIRPPDC